MLIPQKIALEKIQLPTADVELWVQREDLIHPFVSGNKFRKLKYNLAHASAQHKSIVLTFGGAFSNHIAATAAASHLLGFKSIGIIRGDELGRNLKNTLSKNATLKRAHELGMVFIFVSRLEYKLRADEAYLESLKKKYPSAFIIPEGGTNAHAILGCKEIISQDNEDFDFVCCPVGTGGTISGIIEGAKPNQTILGFPSLKGDFLENEIKKNVNQNNWKLFGDYDFGGYAKVTADLVRFMNSFYEKNKILLDPVYTGKMFFGIYDLIARGYFPANSRILAVHTGGLQGIAGMNDKLAKKGLPIIIQ